MEVKEEEVQESNKVEFKSTPLPQPVSTDIIELVEGVQPANKTDNSKKSIKFNKQAPQTKKGSRADSIQRKLDYLSEYIQALEQGTADIRNNVTFAILELYREIFKGCPTFKEVDMNDKTAIEYQKVIGLYYKKGDVVCQLIPIEEGWKAIGSEKSKYNIKTEAGDQEVEGIKVSFIFEGVLPEKDYPTTYESHGQSGHEAILKLRDYLYSLKK